MRLQVVVVVAAVTTSLAQDTLLPGSEGMPVTSPQPLLAPGEERVLVLQESGAPSDLSYARLVAPPFPELSSFTACYWLRLTRFREESTMMSYAVSDDRDNELRMDHRITEYKVSLRSTWVETSLETPFRLWSHFCFTFHHGSGAWEIFLNGESRAEGNLGNLHGPIEPAGAYIIGQEQDRFGGGFQRDQSFSGEITQLNFWSSVLNGFTIAKVVGGRLLVPLTEQENAEVYERSRERASYCSKGQGSSYLWMGATDTRQERLWEYWNTRQPVSWEGPWRGSGPNGDTAENCLVMLSGSFPAQWSDIACLDSYSFCVPCEFPQLSTLYLKGPGLCPNSPFNLEYVLGPEEGGRPALHGYFHSDIFWDAGNHSWTIRSQKVEDVAARWWPLREGMYPFGTKMWELAGEVCDLLPGTLVNLTLSVCRTDQFTCSDGTCIPLLSRCDLRIDCSDQSDEAQCSVVQLPQGYRSTIPPPPTKESSPLEILLYLDIIAFPSIVTQDLTFVTTMSLSLRWKDIRLSYLNLKDDRTLNLLFGEAVASIWTPRVFFSNAQGNVFTNLDQGARVEAVRQGSSQPAPPHLTHEMNIFSGLDNSMEMSQLYTLTYTCDFDLIMFPFDAQVCFLRFTLVSAAATYMVLLPAAANYSGPSALIEYTIGQLDMEEYSDGEFSTVQVNVRFVRRYGFYLLTLYIPTTLLMVIAYATFFFNIDDFNSRIVVALTALLVLASLFTQTSNSLPKTSYFKLVDIWLFFSIVIIFVVVMLQTLIDYSLGNTWFTKCLSAASSSSSSSTLVQVLRMDAEVQKEFSSIAAPTSGKESNKAMMKLGRIIVPVIFLIFNLAYWGSALTYLASLDT